MTITPEPWSNILRPQSGVEDMGEPLADPGRRAGEDGDPSVEAEQAADIHAHGGESYGAAPRRRDGLLLAVFFAAITAWSVTSAVTRDVTPLGVASAVLLVVASTAAVAALLRIDRRRESTLTSALLESESRQRLLFDASAEPMWIFDAETLQVRDANVAATRVLGWSRDELLGMTVTELQTDASPRQLRSGSYEGEWHHRHRDGGTIVTTVSTRPVLHRGRPARLSVLHDLTAARDNDARTKAIVDNATDAILTIDLDGHIESVNPAAERMFGWPASALVGRSASQLMHALDGMPVSGVIPEVGRDVAGLRHDGTTFPLELAVTDVVLGDRTVTTVIARDITERKALENRLTSQATHDPLTGLPNRLLFFDRLAQALGRAQRTGRPLAVLFCDLDRFKVVNDSLGHTAGDALLFAAANRFREAVRDGDTVARFGGDEFMVLAEGLVDDTDAIRVAEQLTRSLDEPVRIGSKEIHVTASVGIVVGHPDRDTVEGLVRDADAAMFRAKANGRARFEVFDAALRQHAMQRLEVESELRAALLLDEFVVHYQPEIELATNRIVGLEALVRWEHPGDARRGPAIFLPVAEETGLIVPIGGSVLEQACTEAARWHSRLGDVAPTVWVNVSARQLASLDLIPMIEDAVRTYLPRPDALGLEITETDIVLDDDLSRRTMAALVDIGVKLAIDDFGTGFASLSYLWRFPADVVKIDQSFVRQMTEDRDARVLVKAMIDMAHSLGKTIVAEGVELEAQLAQLRSLGCDAAQGYLLARPQPASQIDALFV